MHLYLILLVTTAVFIAARAFQQLNVQHDRYWWVPPTTTTMAVCEVVSITSIVKSGSLWAIVPLAVGGTLGCWFAMWLHKRLRKGD
jgi:hypothetical protein